MENKIKTPKERIEDIRKQIAATTDKHHVAKLFDEALRLQKQDDDMNKELCIDIADVKRTADFESFKVKETTRGYLFQYASGAYTAFVGRGYGSVCAMLDFVLNAFEKQDKGEFEESMTTAITTVFQAPFFAALGINNPEFGLPVSYDALFNIATSMLKEINAYKEKHLDNAESRPETDEDVRKNIEAENVAQGIQTLIDAPLPPEV